MFPQGDISVYYPPWRAPFSYCLEMFYFPILLQMHAEYKIPPNDEYLAHRVSQAFEMSQFIKTTSESCDMVIAAGDFNSRPESVAYHILRKNALLKDAWLDQVCYSPLLLRQRK
jgi:sphingomyelin phosphodiesterase 2